MNYKAAFFDIDGTLLSHTTGEIPKSSFEALRRAKEKGIRIVMCTGRSPTELNKINVDLDLFDDFITTNGHIILDENREIIADNPIPDDKIQIIIDLFNEKKIPLTVNTFDDIFMNIVDERARRILTEIHTPIHRTKPYEGETVYQVVAYPGRENTGLIEELSKDFLVTHWHPDAVDIIAAGGGKGWGLEAYIDAKGIKRSETIAFGDGANDLEMIKKAGMGVAMGNAEQVLKDAADYVTGDIDNDGLYDACVKFGLI